jgi:hypothetical protein
MKQERLRSRRRSAPGKDEPRAVSAAEEAARTAEPCALTEAEKSKLAAEVARIEDA